MPFIRQVKQNGKPGGAGLGRVFPVDTIANQYHGLENRYMIGSGVGAVSSSNRRALMRRAYRYVPPPPFVPISPATLSAFIVPSTKEIGNADFYPTAFPAPVFPDFGSGAITYSSSNPAVATIDATSGFITIVGPGTVTFTAVQAADAIYISTTVRSNTLTISAVILLDAPTAVSSVGGDTVGYIIFTAPSAVGKPAITNYEYSIDGSDFVALSPAQTYSPIMIPGLTNGTTYTTKIRAVNSDGPGAESDESSFVPGTNTLYGTSRLVRLEAGDSSSYGGSGTAWTNLDSAGSYSATLQNAPTYQSATTPKYFSFNGTNQIAQIAAAAAINPTVGSSFTLQIWAKVDKTSANFASGDGLISKQYGDDYDYDGYSLSLTSIDSKTILNMNGSGVNGNYGSGINVYSGSVWALYTIVVRFGGGSGNPSQVYVNGRRVVSVGNGEGGFGNNQAPLQFPRGIQEGAFNFAPADVGAFYVYNTALSQETIIRNFDATKPTYGVQNP